MSTNIPIQAIDDGVWVHTSDREMTTSTIVALDNTSCMLIDPAITPSDLDVIADFVEERGLRVTLGWSTHAHWDHVLWSARFGVEVPRLAVSASVDTCKAELAELHEYISQQCPGHDVDLSGLLTTWSDTEPLWPVNCQVIEHRAHAPGHAALWITNRQILVAGDMVSDIEIPTLDLEQSDPLSDYFAALDLYAHFLDWVVTFIPGHGRPGDQGELDRRITLDRRYLDDIATGASTSDDRIRAQWLKEHHERQAAWAKEQR
ncbi:MBL fold metallo-hydrolase [Ferrimicrobium sp.]|uniref:MBL fold metallo-hydrolase n=1 Tax=Ferrimicrobium sp. TaxID=2926050 RepID=UPI002612A0CF|nr:MBL fold metallo-hydrolase [Ferrimicrobium sp.]